MDSEAKKILELIEAVDINNTAALDEIDARVSVYITNAVTNWQNSLGRAKQYTRSRDALKSIRPESMEVYSINNKYYKDKLEKGWCVSYSVRKDLTTTLQQFNHDPVAPTEELAELSAIIQAIAYERSK